jgi:N-acetylneuraminate epimerase|tara:strand:- start:632 stop:1561 length:930 start_codon:yes stop_codon:yes gene_type:complete
MRKLLFSAALVFAAGPVMAEEWPDLPVGVKNGIAARVGERLIVGLGSAGTELFSLDLTNREAGWQQLPDFPGPAPSMPAAAASGEDLYVFSGSGKLHEDDASPIIFDTGWKLGANGWQQLGSTTPAGLLGASALSLPDDRIAVIGGYNKEMFDTYLAEITAVNKDDDPETCNKIVNSYMAMKPEDYRWNDLVLIYDPAGDNWSDLGADPSLPNTGSAVVRTKPGTFYIINGEVKPGLRTDQVKTLKITDGTAIWGSLPPVPAPEGANIQTDWRELSQDWRTKPSCSRVAPTSRAQGRMPMREIGMLMTG